MPFALLAFDLDGTLADTESIAMNDLLECLHQEFQLPITREQWLTRYHGMTGEPLMAKINADFGRNITYAEFLPVRNARLPSLFQKGINLAPGLMQVLRTLVANHRNICIATNSHPTRNVMLFPNLVTPPDLPFPGIFKNHVFSGVPEDGVTQPKPAPDVYLNAAKAFNLNPVMCLAVEDSASGATAALAAGFTTLGYTGLAEDPQHATALLHKAGVHAVFHHWDDFLALLAKLEA